MNKTPQNVRVEGEDVNEKTEYKLGYCDNCYQATNFLGKVCQKCHDNATKELDEAGVYVYVVYAISDHGSGRILKLDELEDMDGYEIPIGMFSDDVVVSIERQRKGTTKYELLAQKINNNYE